MFSDIINIVIQEYVKKRIESLKNENEELKRELRKRNSIDVEYVVIDDLTKCNLDFLNKMDEKEESL